MSGLPMLRATKSVRDEVLRQSAGKPVTIEVIAKVFTELTIIDEIIYVKFDAGPDNPFWGRFSRWSRSPGVYSPAVTVVEVCYAAHLDSCCRKFTVCKELCHALESSSGSFVAPSNIDNLVAAFAIRSALGGPRKLGEHVRGDFQPEIFAEICAVEILFPMPKREEILSGCVNADDALIAKIAAEHDIPLMYAGLALDQKYNEAVKGLLDGDADK